MAPVAGDFPVLLSEKSSRRRPEAPCAEVLLSLQGDGSFRTDGAPRRDDTQDKRTVLLHGGSDHACRHPVHRAV